MDWDTSCIGWEQKLLSGQSLVPDLPLFETEAERALRIFKRLKIPDVIGTPTMAEACGPWFFRIVSAMFGSYDPALHKRMIQEFFLLIPKKNAKSSNAGAVMVTALIMNRRPANEFLLIAPTKEIADIAFKQASGTIRADDELAKLFHIQRHIRLITHRQTEATLQIKAADTDVITGSKAGGTLIDETHVFAKKSRAADIFLELRGALAARPDGFLFQITTQSKGPPSGVFKKELQRARDVRDGKIKLPMLPVLYELPAELSKDGGWKDRKNWGYVNPNMGHSVGYDFLEREVITAEGDLEQEILLASQHFNVEIGLSLRDDRWAGADYWLESQDDDLSLDDLIERSEVIVAGVDGGGLDDLFGLSVMGRDKNTREWLSWSRAWCHSGVLVRRKSLTGELRDFEKSGDLTIYDHLGDDIDEIVATICKLDASGKLAEKDAIGMDPMGVGSVVDALAAAGIGDDRIVAVSQGYKLQGAIKTVERKLADGTLKHSTQPIMDWCVGNAKIEMRGNAAMITKQASGTGKIDPLMALFCAATVMGANPVAAAKKSPRVYVF